MAARKRAHGGRRRSYGKGPRRPSEVLQGKIRVVRPGVATVTTPEGQYPVAKGGIREAMDGDEVRVSIVARRGQEHLAVVRDVVSRATASFVGTFGVADPLGVVTPLDGRLHRDFFVLPEDEAPRRLGVREGDVVRARILEYPTRHSAGVVTLDARLGTAGDLDLDMEAVVASYGLPGPFPPAALAEADALEDDVARAAQDSRRHDLRARCVVTVDPVDARDFDDAVDAHRLEDGGFEVGVHIADVSHYVAWGSSLDAEARARTCSVYLADRVIPMLPEHLCNGLCSLVPQKDRLTMSVILRLDAHGQVVGAQAFPATIRSKARLDYGMVDRLLAGELAAEDLPCAPGLAREVAASLATLDEVARLRREVRRARGSVDFETRETKVTLDADGHPTGVLVRERTRATSLIEEAMLMANEAVAKRLAQAEVTAAFRVHERPAPADLKATLPVLRELGVISPADEGPLVAGDPHAIQDALAAAAGKPGELLVSSLLLRAQKRAIYLPYNEGHYALGAPAYCHFTSPIRRYPDLVVHRTLKALLFGKRDSPEQRQVGRALPQICRSCSEMERTADAAARMSQKVKMAELFSDHIGEDFSGVIMGCERFGLFVTLDESGAEGLLPTHALGPEWFAFDDARMSLTSEDTGRVWRVGQRVAVRVAATNPAKGQIDFTLAGR